MVEFITAMGVNEKLHFFCPFASVYAFKKRKAKRRTKSYHRQFVDFDRQGGSSFLERCGYLPLSFLAVTSPGKLWEMENRNYRIANSVNERITWASNNCFCFFFCSEVQFDCRSGHRSASSLAPFCLIQPSRRHFRYTLFRPLYFLISVHFSTLQVYFEARLQHPTEIIWQFMNLNEFSLIKNHKACHHPSFCNYFLD